MSANAIFCKNSKEVPFSGLIKTLTNLHPSSWQYTQISTRVVAPNLGV